MKQLSLVIGLLLFAGAALAMHADQQGKWDWYVQGVGVVQHAAFHPKSASTKAIYVATYNGTVAALRTRSNGDVKWRKTFAPTDKFVCVEAGNDAVVAATSNGKVYAFAAQTGMVRWSNQLQNIVGSDDSVVACYVSGHGVNVVVAKAGSKSLSVWYVSDDTATEKTASPVKLPAAASAVRCDSSNCFVSFDEKEVAYFGSDFKLQQADKVTGAVTNVIGAYAAVADKKAGKAHLLKGGSKVTVKKSSALAKGTSIGLIADEDGSAGLLEVSNSGGRVEISVSSGDKIVMVDVHELDGIAPKVVAARSGKKDEILLKTSDGHLHYVLDSTLSWERKEGMSTVKHAKFGELEDEFNGKTNGDKFAFNELIFLQSEHGRLYALETEKKGAVRWSVNVFSDLLGKYPALTPCGMFKGEFSQLFVEDNAVTTTLKLGNDVYIVGYETTTGIQLSVSHVENVKQQAGHMIINHKNKVNIAPATDFFMFDVDSVKGVVSGSIVKKGSGEVTPTWSVDIGSPIVARADGHNQLAVAANEALRVLPNATTKVNQVRRKYPTQNLLAVASIFEDTKSDNEYPTLAIHLIDTISGAVLAKGELENVDGAVSMILVEHALVFHFLDVKRMRYNLGVWELFESESFLYTDSTTATPGQIITSFFKSAKSEHSSFTARPPQVAAQILAMPGSEVKALGVTTSFYGVARKQIMFAFASGRVAALPLNSLVIGGQPHPKKPTEQITFVLLPGTQIVSHNNLVFNAKAVASTPTRLESSSHTLTYGQDLFYIRLSSGKAFDLLNDDFNFQLLLLVLGVFAGASLILRQLANRSQINLAWA